MGSILYNTTSPIESVKDPHAFCEDVHILRNSILSDSLRVSTCIIWFLLCLTTCKVPAMVHTFIPTSSAFTILSMSAPFYHINDVPQFHVP